VLGRGETVVIHRRAQVLPRARIQRGKLQCVAARRQRHGRRPSAVGDTHDARLAATVLEELFDCVGKRRGLPQAAEALLELVEAADRQRLVHRPLERAADEGHYGGRHALNRVMIPALLCELCACAKAVGHSRASVDLPARL